MGYGAQLFNQLILIQAQDAAYLIVNGAAVATRALGTASIQLNCNTEGRGEKSN